MSECKLPVDKSHDHNRASPADKANTVENKQRRLHNAAVYRLMIAVIECTPFQA